MRGWHLRFWAIAALSVFAAACGAPEPARHAVRGQVAQVLDDGARIVVDHETIPGYMDAMRMTLAVADPSQGRALESGDKIRFELVLAPDGTVVEKIEALAPETKLELAP